MMSHVPDYATLRDTSRTAGWGRPSGACRL